MQSLINQGAGYIPLGILKWMSRAPLGRVGRKLVRSGLANRDVTLSEGIGKDLWFNAARSNASAALGTYELPVQAAIAEHLQPGDVFYDVGANVGFFTVLAANLVGETGRVYAFEPSPENVKSIRHNIQLNGFNQVEVWQNAVAKDNGKGTLLMTDYPGGHTLSTFERPAQVKAEIEVEIVSIDTLIEQGKLQPPNLVKIDVEGAEIAVLEGMQKSLRRDRPTLIYEADDPQKAGLDIKQTELNDYVRQFGYDLHSLEDSYADIGWNVGHTIAVATHEKSC